MVCGWECPITQSACSDPEHLSSASLTSLHQGDREKTVERKLIKSSTLYDQNITVWQISTGIPTYGKMRVNYGNIFSKASYKRTNSPRPERGSLTTAVDKGRKCPKRITLEVIKVSPVDPEELTLNHFHLTTAETFHSDHKRQPHDSAERKDQRIAKVFMSTGTSMTVQNTMDRCQEFVSA